MAENLTENRLPANSLRPGRRRWWIVATVVAFVAITAGTFFWWRRPADETARRTAEILDEARWAERSQGRVAGMARNLPGPLAALGDWLFPQSQKGAYDFSGELGKLGSNTAPVLITCLANDRSPLVREVAAMTLGDLGSVEALPVLTNALVADKADGVREAVIDALAEIGQAAALPALQRAMRTETNESVRGSVVRAVARIGGPAVAPDLLAAAEQEPAWDVRVSFARALVEVQEPRAVPLFASWLDAASATNATADAVGSDPFGFQTYAFSIGQIVEAAGELGGEPAYQLLTNYWSKEGGKTVRESLCQAFSAMGDARALPLLHQALTEEKRVRAAAAEALGQLGDTNALPALLSLVEDADENVRVNAFGAIGRLGNSSAVPVLINALEAHTNREVRAEICEALGQIGDSAALEPMLAVLAGAPKNREKVIWALGFLRDTNAVPALGSALYSTERDESFAAAYGLAAIGGEAAADALAGNLAHQDEFVRHGKACALAMLGRTNGLGTIRQSLVARENWRRFGATLALARLRLPPESAEWRPILEDRDPDLRRLGQEAAAGRVVPALVALLRCRNREFRHYSARGLLFFREPETLPALRVACRDRDQQVRSAATLAVNFVSRAERAKE